MILLETDEWVLDNNVRSPGGRGLVLQHKHAGFFNTKKVRCFKNESGWYCPSCREKVTPPPEFEMHIKLQRLTPKFYLTWDMVNF